MVKPVNDQDEPTRRVGHDSGEEPNAPLSDDLLLELLDALVEVRGRAPAALVLGVNCRTLALCCDSRQVSRRMRRALLEFRNAGAPDSDESEDGHGDRAPNGGVAALEQRVSDLEDENFELRESAEEQWRQLQELARRVATLEEIGQQGDDGDEVVADNADLPDHDRGDKPGQDWRPPRRRSGMPDAGVVTLEEQPDEEHAFGPAALVAERRRSRTGGGRLWLRPDGNCDGPNGHGGCGG